MYWIKRIQVTKGEGHVIYMDLYQDLTTNVQYWGTKEGLTVRVEQDGSPFIGEPII